MATTDQQLKYATTIVNALSRGPEPPAPEPATTYGPAPSPQNEPKPPSSAAAAPSCKPADRSPTATRKSAACGVAGTADHDESVSLTPRTGPPVATPIFLHGSSRRK